jgi:hypothetical protein
MSPIGVHLAQPQQTALHYTKIGVLINWFLRVSPGDGEKNGQVLQ